MKNLIAGYLHHHFNVAIATAEKIASVNWTVSEHVDLFQQTIVAVSKFFIPVNGIVHMCMAAIMRISIHL